MNKTEIYNKVIGILSVPLVFDVDSVSGDTDIRTELGADSLDAVEIMMGIEKAFGVILDDDVYKNVHTIDDIVNGLEKIL